MSTKDKMFEKNLARLGLSQTQYNIHEMAQQSRCKLCEKTQARRLTPYLTPDRQIKALLCTQCAIIAKVPKDLLEKIANFTN